MAARHRISAGALVLLAALAMTAPIPAADDDVVFTAPRHLATVIGPGAIELRINVPLDKVDRVVLTIDNKELVTLTAPPWTAVWDAGDGSRGHRLRATLHLEDGQESSALIFTSALRINQVEEVGLVSLYPVVRDRKGVYVSNLEESDFSILEDGVKQSISRFSTERKPLRIAIVLDTSLSMSKGGRLLSAQQAALNFLGILEPNDEGMLVTFNDTVQIAQELTSDRTRLAGAIQKSEAQGGTALYDAVWRAARNLRDFDGRRVLVLLSDGKDEAANGFEPGSLHTLDEALDQALRSEVMIFAIGLGRRLEQQWDFDRRVTLDQVLFKLAENTGGRTLISPRAGQLKKAFTAVADDLRHQYSLAYISKDARKDGRWRKLEVTVPGRNVEVVTRTGYFAPDSSRSPGAF